MDNYTEDFILIKNRLIEKLGEMVDVYLTDIWDPLMKFTITRELRELLVRELSHEFPDFPIKYLPNIKMKTCIEDNSLEISVQEYLNKDISLIFLGNIEYDAIPYDLYYRESWDPNVPYIFYARYGHDDNSFEKASKKAAAEYMMGIITPLSTAYSFAIDEGIVE